MKKIVISLVCILTLMLSLSVTVRAEEERPLLDSINGVSQEVKEQIDLKETDQVFLCYNIYLPGFEGYSNLEEYFENAPYVDYIYAVKDESGNFKCWLQQDDGDITVITSNYAADPRAMEALQNEEIASNIAPDVEVYNVYLLDDQANDKGIAIYYTTNKGDYVYFMHYSIGGVRLFPVDAFREYLKTVREMWEELLGDNEEGYVQGSIDIGEVMDLSQYDPNSDKFDLHAPFSNCFKKEPSTWVIVAISAGGVLLVSGVVIGIIFWRKKRKQVTAES